MRSPTFESHPRNAARTGPRQSVTREGAVPVPARMRSGGSCACGGECPRCEAPGTTDTSPLDGVRVHFNSQRAQDLGALAFTQDRQIHIVPGQWAPDTAAGRDLLGHELGHVLQQRRGRVAPNARLGATALNDDGALEREADTLGQRALRGRGWFDALAVGSANGAAMPHGTVQRRSSPVPQICPPPATLSCARGIDNPPRISQQFLFDQDSDKLDAAQITALDAVAAATCEPGGGTVLRIDGYASAEGGCAYNWALSCRRAAAISAALQAHSNGGACVPAAQIRTLAKGESDAAGDALSDNRRATLLVPPPLPIAHGPDQRVSALGGVAAEPNAALAAEIGFELDPSSRPAPAPVPPPAPPGAPPRAVPPLPVRRPPGTVAPAHPPSWRRARRCSPSCSPPSTLTSSSNVRPHWRGWVGRTCRDAQMKWEDYCNERHPVGKGPSYWSDAC